MRILIAEDEFEIAKALKKILEKNKYAVDMVHSGTDAWAYLSAVSYDVIILDIMMPGMSGLDVLAKARKHKISTPVLLLTAKAEVDDRITGLNAGADDYLPKPFDMGELLARVKALSRRNESYTAAIMEYGNVVLDCNKYDLYTKSESVRLNNKEFQLMECFMKHPRMVFSTERLMENIWGLDSDANIDVVWTYIGFIRRKLKVIGADIEIRTIRGAGFSLEMQDHAG